MRGYNVDLAGTSHGPIGDGQRAPSARVGAAKVRKSVLLLRLKKGADADGYSDALLLLLLVGGALPLV